MSEASSRPKEPWVLPYAPWHRPKWREVALGVEVFDTYGSHVIAALIHWPFAALARRIRRV